MRIDLILASMLVLCTATCGDDGGGAEAGGSTTTSGPDTTGGLDPTGPGTTSSSEGSGSGSGTAADTTATAADTTAAPGDTTAVTTDASTGSTSGGSTSGDATTDGSTTEVGMGSLDVAMSNLQIFQNCQPIVSPDPVNAGFTLELTNSGDGPASATVVSATFLDAGGMQAAVVDVMPDAFGPIDAGETAMIVVGKVPDSMMPANGCETLDCGGLYTLELVLDVDGVEVTASETEQVGCVF